MHGIEEGLLDKGCAEASDLLYLSHCGDIPHHPR